MQSVAGPGFRWPGLAASEPQLRGMLRMEPAPWLKMALGFRV